MKKWWHIVIAVGVLVGLFAYLNYDVKQENQKKESDEKAGLLFAADFKWAEVTALTMDTGAVVVTAVPKNPALTAGKTPDQWEWTLTEPFPTEAESTDLQNYFRTLKELKVKSVVDENATAVDSYGLDEKVSKPLRFTLGMKSGEKKVLLVGVQNFDASGNYAKFTDSKKVVLVENRLNYLKNKELEQFRRKVLAEYDNQQVSKISYNWGKEGEIVVERQGEDWRLSKPFGAFADKMKISSFLADLKNVRIDKFPSEKGDAEAATYGFKAPRGTVTLSFETASDIKLIVGGESKEKTSFYVRRADSQSVYQVQTFHLDKLKKDLNYFIEHDLGNFEAGIIQNVTVVEQGAVVPVDLTLAINGIWQISAGGAVQAASFDKVQFLIRKVREMAAKNFVSRQPEKGQGLEQPALQIVLKGAPTVDKQVPTYHYLFAQSKTKGGEKVYVQGGRNNFVSELDANYLKLLRDTFKEVRDRHPLVNPTAYGWAELSRGADGKQSVAGERKNEKWAVSDIKGAWLPKGVGLAGIMEALSSLEVERYLVGVTGGKSENWQADAAKDLHLVMKQWAPGKAPKQPGGLVYADQEITIGATPLKGGYFVSVKGSGPFDAYEAVLKKANVDRLLEVMGLNEKK